MGIRFSGEMNERQCKSPVTKKENARADMARAESPRLTFNDGQTMEGVREVANTTGQRHVSGEPENTAERSPDVSCAVKMAMNSLPDHRKMTKTKSCTRPQQHVCTWSVRPARVKSSAGGSRATQKHKTHDACRSCFGVQRTLLAGFRACWTRIPPAFTSRKLEVGPSLVVASLVRGLQPNGRRDDVDGPVAHGQTLFFLRFREHDEIATFKATSSFGALRWGPKMA